MARKVTTTLAVALFALSAAAAIIDKRTVGGEDAADGEIPFMVSLRDKHGIYSSVWGQFIGQHYCSDCCSLRVGITVSEGRNGDGTWNDLAILKLSTPIEKSKTISYAVLPADGSDPIANSMAMSAGWGHNDKNELSPPQLSKIVLPVIARELCPHSQRAADIIAGRDTLVCTGGNGKSLCNRDSGGPLIDDKTKQLIGIAAFSVSLMDCQPNNRMLFVRVGSYISFINENLGSSGSGQA